MESIKSPKEALDVFLGHVGKTWPISKRFHTEALDYKSELRNMERLEREVSNAISNAFRAASSTLRVQRNCAWFPLLRASTQDLSYIISRLLLALENPTDIWTLSQVCAKMRQACLSDPSLWRHVDLTRMSPKLATEMIARGGHEELIIDLTQTPSGAVAKKPARHRYGVRPHPQPYADRNRHAFIKDNSAAIRELHLTVEGMQSCLENLKMPSLETLHVDSDDRTSVNYLMDVFEHGQNGDTCSERKPCTEHVPCREHHPCPRLKQLFLQGVLLSGSPVALVGLTSLSISLPEPVGDCISTLLKALPNLEDLGLHASTSGMFPTFPSTDQDKFTVFAKLKCLHLELVASDIYNFLSSILTSESLILDLQVGRPRTGKLFPLDRRCLPCLSQVQKLSVHKEDDLDSRICGCRLVPQRVWFHLPDPLSQYHIH
ncbi:unnamed protein product [Somion occarium]|uniref:F-box domain-containing protein n=1 Tax=Somion occarium TaxID=3059160 RepID=A0ABP1D986_9APHY